MKWFKVATDLFTDEKILLIESMKKADSILVIWMKLLCLAGKSENDGVLKLNDRISYTDEMLSKIFHRPVRTVRLAMETFVELGMIEIVEDTYSIPNWTKHQSVEAYSQQKGNRNEYYKDYMRKKRASEAETTNTEESLVNTSVNTSVNTPVNTPVNTLVNTSVNTPVNSEVPHVNTLDIEEDKEGEEEREEDKEREKEIGVVVNTTNNSNPYSEDTTLPRSDTLEAYITNWLPRLSPTVFAELLTYRDELPDEVIRYAIDVAIEQGKANSGYVKAILNRYVQDNLNTIEKIKASEERYRNGRKQGPAKRQRFVRPAPKPLGPGEIVL